MKRFNQVISTIFLFCLSASAVVFGQEIHFNDNGQIKAEASLTNINRIFVKGDKIIQHIAPQNTFVFDKRRSEDGSLYFKPIYPDKFFTIFFATKHGHHFSVVVNPVVSTGKTLKLMANNVTEQDHPWAKNTPYLAGLQKLISAMIKGDDPHFVLQKVKDSPYIKSADALQIKMLGVTSGLNMTGITYDLANTANHPVTLLHRAFWRKGVLAIAFEKEQVFAHGHSKMWMIVEGSGND